MSAEPGLRALADVLGGFEGGLSFWRASLAGLELALERARERSDPFTAWPAGEFNRLLRDLSDALELAALAVEVQQLLNEEPDGRHDQREQAIADVLLERARQVAEAKSLGPRPV